VTNGSNTFASGVASFQVIDAASLGVVLSNVTTSVSQTENVVSRVLVRLNRIVEAFDDKAASR
jgi:hypothetical protein